MPRGGKRKGAGRPRTRIRPNPPETPSKPTGKWSLSRREELFIHLLLTKPEASQGQCYIDAGFRAKNADTASTNASRLLGKDRVARALAAAREQMASRNKVTQDRVLQELARIAFFDIRKMFEARAGREGSDHVDVGAFYKQHRPEGPAWATLSKDAQEAWILAAQLAAQPVSGGFFLKSPDQLDDETAAAVAGVDVVTKKIGDGEVEYVHKISTVPKMGALTTLAKHVGLLKDDPLAGKGGGLELAWQE